MIYFQTRNTVIETIHYMPFDPECGLHKTEEELRKDGYLVDKIPDYGEDVPDGKTVVTHYTPEKGFWFTLKSISIADDISKRLEEVEAWSDYYGMMADIK